MQFGQTQGHNGCLVVQNCSYVVEVPPNYEVPERLVICHLNKVISTSEPLETRLKSLELYSLRRLILEVVHDSMCEIFTPWLF